MHQSFEFIEDVHYCDPTPRGYAAAALMVQKLREGKVKLVGDVLVDVSSYKVVHKQPYPFDMDAFKGVHAAMYAGDDVEEKVIIVPEETREIVEPAFDFDRYNGVKR